MSQDPRQDEGDELEAWKPPPPPPPMPKFPDIPRSSEGSSKPEESRLAGIGAGWSLAIDFVSTIVASWLIGFAIDWWQKTTPWGSLIGLGLGFAYAIVRILQNSQRQERQSRK